MGPGRVLEGWFFSWQGAGLLQIEEGKGMSGAVFGCVIKPAVYSGGL